MKEFLSYFIPLMFALVGIPAYKYLYDASQNTTISVVLTVVYEVAVIVISFLQRVREGLEKRLADRAVENIDRSLQAGFSGYRSRYLRYLVYEHRGFDVKGLTTQGTYNLELGNIYVQLRVDPTPIHEVQSSPVQILPGLLRSGSRTIWEYVGDGKDRGSNYAILGAPGSGKTTLLKHMALTLAAPKKERRKQGAPNLLPVLLFLRDHQQSISNNPSIPLAQLIQNQFAARQAPIPPAGWLEKQIDEGTCLIMLDGLDEVAGSEPRKLVVNWVDQCMASYGKNRFVLTSRPFGYKSNPLANVTVLEVQPFTPQQVEKFLHNWYLATEIKRTQKSDPGVQADAGQGALDLIERLQSGRNLFELAVNPLLLTMIATVHYYRGTLPGRRVDLYAEICEVFLGKRHEARGLQLDIRHPQKIRVLSELAFYMMFKQIQEIDATEAVDVISVPLALVSPETEGGQFIQDVEDSSGLIIELENGRYSFSHLTFQEYLAAVYSVGRLEPFLINHVKDQWWRETILLYCAQADASKIILACLEASDATALSLAIECVDEAHAVIKPEVRKRYLKEMENGMADPDPEIRKLIGDAMLRNRTQ